MRSRLAGLEHLDGDRAGRLRVRRSTVQRRRAIQFCDASYSHANGSPGSSRSQGQSRGRLRIPHQRTVSSAVRSPSRPMLVVLLPQGEDRPRPGQPGRGQIPRYVPSAASPIRLAGNARTSARCPPGVVRKRRWSSIRELRHRLGAVPPSNPDRRGAYMTGSQQALPASISEETGGGYIGLAPRGGQPPFMAMGSFHCGTTGTADRGRCPTLWGINGDQPRSLTIFASLVATTSPPPGEPDGGEPYLATSYLPAAYRFPIFPMSQERGPIC